MRNSRGLNAQAEIVDHPACANLVFIPDHNESYPEVLASGPRQQVKGFGSPIGSDSQIGIKACPFGIGTTVKTGSQGIVLCGNVITPTAQIAGHWEELPVYSSIHGILQIAMVGFCFHETGMLDRQIKSRRGRQIMGADFHRLANGSRNHGNKNALRIPRFHISSHKRTIGIHVQKDIRGSVEVFKDGSCQDAWACYKIVYRSVGLEAHSSVCVAKCEVVGNAACQRSRKSEAAIAGFDGEREHELGLQIVRVDPKEDVPSAEPTTVTPSPGKLRSVYIHTNRTRNRIEIGRGSGIGHKAEKLTTEAEGIIPKLAC